MLETISLTKNFGKLLALDGVGVRMVEGQAVALVGPNGSGKTTFLKCVLGLVVPDGGDVLLEGRSVLGKWEHRKSIGYMPQIGRYPENLRVRQLFEMMKELREGPAAIDDDLMKGFGVKNFEDKAMRTLSGGTRQKVSACLAFLFSPPVLVLDEPTAGLDPLSAEILKEKVLLEKKKGRLVLVTSHILSDLEDMATDVLYLMDGRVRLFEPIEKLKRDHGSDRLDRAIAHLMKQGA